MSTVSLIYTTDIAAEQIAALIVDKPLSYEDEFYDERIPKKTEIPYPKAKTKFGSSSFSFYQNKSRPFKAAWMTSSVKEEEEDN